MGVCIVVECATQPRLGELEGMLVKEAVAAAHDKYIAGADSVSIGVLSSNWVSV